MPVSEGAVALLWAMSQQSLIADMSPDTMARFKRGEAVKDGTIARMQAVLEAAGGECIPANGGGGPGLRLRQGGEMP